MTLEDFETELRQAWIENGMADERSNWFKLEIEAQYKQKKIRVWDTITDFEVATEKPKWQEAFSDILFQLLIRSRKIQKF